MRIKIDGRNRPFKEIKDRFFSPTARRELFGIAGREVKRKAQKGALTAIGGNFGHEIRRSVSFRVKGNNHGVVIGSSHYAANQKQFGGKISAPGKGPGSTGAKFLAIPVADEAKGKNPREFNDLFVLRLKKRPFLVRDTENGGLDILFLLVKSVTQKAYPWFPLGRDAEKCSRRAVQIWIKKREA